MRLTHGGAVWLMVAVTLMWGTAGVVTRHLAQAHSFEITFWRSLFTTLALLVILPLWRGRAVFSQLRRGGRELWISGVCWAVMFTAFMVALTLASTASVLVTMSLGPLLTALAARFFIGHKLPARTWLAIVVAGAGIGWMYGTQLMQGGGGSLAGTLLALCVPLAGAANWTVVQHAQAKGHKVDLVPAVLIGAVLTALFTLPFAWPFRASAHDPRAAGLSWRLPARHSLCSVGAVRPGAEGARSRVAGLAGGDLRHRAGLDRCGRAARSERADWRGAGHRRAGVQRTAGAAQSAHHGRRHRGAGRALIDWGFWFLPTAAWPRR
jgi:drug/metabolite transporter (DMT)-like permease